MNATLSLTSSRLPLLTAAALCAASLVFLSAGHAAPGGGPTAGAPPAIDPQKVRDQQDMTWDDYRPIPDIDWADPAHKPEREFHMALVAIDFPDQPFVITLPKKSELFGNPQIDPVPREKVPQFYADFYNKPNAVNHGHTINGYWMEQSRGKFGIVSLEPFGPYRMPTNFWEYGLNEGTQPRQRDYTPTGIPARGNMDRDCDALWRADKGSNVAQPYRRPNGAVLRIYAGYDETGVWQEFGEMKFKSKDDIPVEWGNPNTNLPRWVPTRYVDWTSWRAGAQQWGVSSIHQGENSGTITHELGHFAFSIGDLNNNPYVTPYRRVAVGPWDIMDRGSFNGPGGPHSRWVVPAAQGASMPAGFMLRNRMKNGFVGNDEVLRLNRDGLAQSGLAVAKVMAREVAPDANTVAGIIVRLNGGDKTPVDDPGTNPLSPGTPNYNFYSLEAVQRIGYDSFCPDNGVLIARNKDNEGRNGGPNSFNGFIWIIDAHPEDINMVDYIQPGTGKPVMRTIADYRQLNDAPFHAGLNSGSQYEYEDAPNRLHFYIIDLQKDAKGLMMYTLGVRSLDGAGPQTRGVAVQNGPQQWTAEKCYFQVRNTGAAAATDAALHPQDANAYLDNDIYRLSVSVEGQGWTAQLQNALTAVKFGDAASVPVFISHAPGAAASAKVTIKATSESDPTKTATSTQTVATGF